MTKDHKSSGGSPVETSHTNVESFPKTVKISHSRSVAVARPTYPLDLKQLTLEILREYKKQLAHDLGKKNIGWTIIRNIIMKNKDEVHPDGFDERLKRDDLESWDRGRSTPGDDKFIFVDNFVKTMEKSGKFRKIRLNINRIKHQYRRSYLNRLFSSPYSFSENHPDDYNRIVSLMTDSFWISSVTSANYYKQFLLYIGHLEGSTFDTMALYFPRELDLSQPNLNLQGTFAAGGVVIIESLKGGLPARTVTTPFRFGSSFTIFLFREENRGGEDAAFTTAELDFYKDHHISIRWGRTINAPTALDYMYHTGLPDSSHLGSQLNRPPLKELDHLKHPESGNGDGGIYIGGLNAVDSEKYDDLRNIFGKFEI